MQDNTVLEGKRHHFGGKTFSHPWLAGGLAGWWAGRLAGWLVGWLVGWSAGWLAVRGARIPTGVGKLFQAVQPVGPGGRHVVSAARDTHSEQRWCEGRMNVVFRYVMRLSMFQ